MLYIDETHVVAVVTGSYWWLLVVTVGNFTLLAPSYYSPGAHFVLFLSTSLLLQAMEFEQTSRHEKYVLFYCPHCLTRYQNLNNTR